MALDPKASLGHQVQPPLTAEQPCRESVRFDPQSIPLTNQIEQDRLDRRVGGVRVAGEFDERQLRFAVGPRAGVHRGIAESLAEVIRGSDEDAARLQVRHGGGEHRFQIGFRLHVADRIVNEHGLEFPVQTHGPHVAHKVLDARIQASRMPHHGLREVDSGRLEVGGQVREVVPAASAQFEKTVPSGSELAPEHILPASSLGGIVLDRTDQRPKVSQVAIEAVRLNLRRLHRLTSPSAAFMPLSYRRFTPAPMDDRTQSGQDFCLTGFPKGPYNSIVVAAVAQW